MSGYKNNIESNIHTHTHTIITCHIQGYMQLKKHIENSEWQLEERKGIV